MPSSPLTIALVLSLAAVPAFTAAQEPVTFQATYRLFSSGLEIAGMNRTVSKHNNEEYIYQSTTQTTGLAAVLHKDNIVEESRWKLAGEQLLPLHYSYTRTKGKKNRRINVYFDRDKNLIINRVNEQILEMPLQPGVMDKLLYQYAIMRDLDNKPFPLTYHIPDGRKMTTYHFEPAGEEILSTPLGEISTIKLLSNDPEDNKKLIIWCAPNLHNLPVKVEHTEDGRVTTAVIATLTGMRD